MDGCPRARRWTGMAVTMTMPAETEDDRARARELWSAGYSLRYIARALGVGGRTAEKLVGRKLLAQRETWRWTADAEGRR